MLLHKHLSIRAYHTEKTNFVQGKSNDYEYIELNSHCHIYVYIAQFNTKFYQKCDFLY